MTWTIKVSSKAEHYYKRLDKKSRRRFRDALLSLSKHENPLDHEDVKPLTGDLRGFYRLRIGGYRVVFSLLKDQRIIAVVNIAPRGNAY